MSLMLEVRCPVGPKQLLAKVRAEGAKPKVSDGNLLELACRDCTKVARREDPDILRVVHRFDLAGQLVESFTESR